MCLKSHWTSLTKNILIEEQMVCFGAKFYFYFFPIAGLWYSLEWNVIQQIKTVAWPCRPSFSKMGKI